MERSNDINKAYQDFSKVLNNYSDATADFMRDCVFIADFKGNNGVKDLPSQGFTRTLAASPFGDDLHLQYENGDKGIDIYFLPDQNKVKFTLLGFNPEDKYADTTKVFTTRDGADAVAEFVNNLPNYKGESKKKESKLKIKVHESKKSERTTHIIGSDDFISWLYEGDMAARDEIASYSEDEFNPEYMDEAVKKLLPQLFKMYEEDKSVEELSEALQTEYYNS